MQSAAGTFVTWFVFIVFAIIALVAVVVVLRAMWAIIKLPSGSGSADSAMTAEDEGNARSGPHGYTGGAYPESQYGSGFDPDADWNRGGD